VIESEPLRVSFEQRVNFLSRGFIHFDERRPGAFETFARNFLRRVDAEFVAMIFSFPGHRILADKQIARTERRRRLSLAADNILCDGPGARKAVIGIAGDILPRADGPGNDWGPPISNWECCGGLGINVARSTTMNLGDLFTTQRPRTSLTVTGKSIQLKTSRRHFNY